MARSWQRDDHFDDDPFWDSFDESTRLSRFDWGSDDGDEVFNGTDIDVCDCDCDWGSAKRRPVLQLPRLPETPETLPPPVENPASEDHMD